MITNLKCDDCIHVDVCSKKDKYEMFMDVLDKMFICPADSTVLYAKDCSDVVIDTRCSHYKCELGLISKELSAPHC